MFPVNNLNSSFGPGKTTMEVAISQQLDEEPFEDFDQISTLDAHDDFEDLETLEMYSACNMCPSCDAEFLSEQSLNEHINLSHPELITSGQNVPGGDKTTNEEAEAGKDLDAWHCNICQRNFSYRNSLAYHLRSHSGERPFSCDTCNKRFFTNSALKVHQRQHSREKPYQCPDCGRSFRQPGDLRNHQRSIHSGELSFQCEYCEKKFARKYSLVVHRRIHTGDRNYKCEVCSKSFRAACYLNSHRKIHTGERSHICDLCGKAFRMRSDLKRHVLAHEKNMKIAEITITPLEVVDSSELYSASASSENETLMLAPADVERTDTILITSPPSVGGSLIIGGQSGTIIGEVTVHPSENYA